MARKLLTIVGARPQFIKAAALSRALADAPGLEERIVHTGQHFDDNMSKVFFDELAIPEPAYHLDVHGGGHGRMTGRMLERLEEVMLAERPDAVLVYGDTNSTLAGALAASKLHVPVAHVEAGLRSHNRRMPEEINRVVTDHLSTVLFCPTRAAVANLEKEGITSGLHAVGDVMFDATIYAREQAARASRIWERLGLAPGSFALCTLHRAENTDERDRLEGMLRFIEAEAGTGPVIFPIHPRTRAAIARFGLDPGRITLIEPVGYFDLHRLLSGARLVLTDSGGLQKEAYFHRVPCITLRDETEWVETVEHGWNRLWTVKDWRPRSDVDDYGAGRSAAATAAILQRWLR